jgi:hypothetical protein
MLVSFLPPPEGECCGEMLSLLREYLSGHKQDVDRNTNSKDHSGEFSDAKGKHGTMEKGSSLIQSGGKELG